MYQVYFILNEPLTYELYDYLYKQVKYREGLLLEYGIGEFKSEKVNELPVNEKIALFCRAYKYYKLIPYKVSPSDAGKIKHIDINKQLLKVYFTSNNFLFKGKHSISNLVKYFNELRSEAAAPASGKFPNKWDKDFERKLSGKELIEYWKHLRAIGWVRVTPVQGAPFWKEKPQNPLK